jgi:NitT/TauT family transport system ATP-binding protein
MTRCSTQSTSSTPTVIIDRLGLHFQDQIIYQGLSLTISQNEFVCIVGPSGCGKSTLLRLIGGLLGHQAGTITVNGMSPADAWASMAYVFQSPRLVPWRNAIDNVALGAELRQRRPDRAALKTKAVELLTLLGLSQDTEKHPAMLSGGERQRVAIARALIVEPDIILMDEPFSALDLKTRERLRAEIISIWSKTKKTIIFVTHDVEEALLLADRVIVLTAKPTKVRETIEITHPRPRNLRSIPELAETRRNLENIMRELEPSTADSPNLD